MRKLGHDLSLARRRRRISTEDMAERVFVSRDTIWRLEKGDPTVSMGTLATAAFILGFEARLRDLASSESDHLGRALEEDRLPKRIRRVRR